jgi:Tfp pilus assembly protein PilF
MESVPRPSNARRVIAGVVALGIVAAAVWLFRLCWIAPQIRFLAPYAGAEWIVFPKPATFDGRPQVELTTTFRKRWVIEKRDASVRLVYRAFEHATVAVNGREMPLPSSGDANWKSALSVDITGWLRSGENEIAITVANRRGPPALWAAIVGGRLRTGADWEAAYAGSAWRSALVASEPLPEARDQVSHRFADIGDAWAAKWKTVVAIAALVLAVAAVWRWWGRFAAGGERRFAAWTTNPATVVLAIAVVAWATMLIHNAPLLPRYAGFDALSHFEYIRFLLERHTLPFASDGMVMYNPPLYYAVAATLLRMAGYAVTSPSSAELLRLVAVGGGIAQLLLLAASLRLVFPDNRRAQALGIAFAAALPANVYLWHYVTNEWLVGLLASASVYATLRVIYAPRVTPAGCAIIGLCLGMALLAKVTALLVAPFLFGAVAFRLWQDRSSARTAIGSLLILVATTLAVCGWQYGRVWLHFGKPIVGGWDRESGLAWWQDQGYVTFSHFLRFGGAVFNPVFGARTGFWDGLYSTLWADGLCGGMSDANARPPWDYALMAVGGTIAIPMAVLLAGAVALAIVRFVKTPTSVGLVVSGSLVGFAGAFVLMYLKVPCYGDLKAFYGLAVLPAATIAFAQLMASPRIAHGWLGRVVAGLVAVWALTTAATYWIEPAAAQTHVLLGMDSTSAAQAESHFVAATRADPTNDLAWENLVATQDALGNSTAVATTLATALTHCPDSVRLRAVAAARADSPAAAERLLRDLEAALASAPDNVKAHEVRIRLLRQLGRPEAMIAACREALCSAPMNAAIHLNLGLALATQSDGGAEAKQQLLLAVQLAPKDVSNLEAASWTLATAADASLRDTAAAAKLARTAIVASNDRSFIARVTLSVALSDSGEFDGATDSATIAASIARAIGHADFERQAQALAERFQQRRPYHDADVRP